ncbi:hypothetical protein BDN72DRAFT_905622 [Pluteus cervinus]|uniref:Uncharacterized protein n=1 Tax=Pluteus cervinus TaxID=181527 RepID=A0ACD3A2R2_9AGAR|nr:hypothetical protein BDN72DRAFT_905622 [Pluteus cervinus]
MAQNKYDKSELMFLSDQSIELTPVDGHVATVSQDQRWYITSPNQSFIPEPAFGSNRSVIRRQDYRFGNDDYIQWPQAYNEKCPHHACILLRQESGPYACMWRDLVPNDFIPSPALSRLGCLNTELLKNLRSLSDELLYRIKLYHEKRPHFKLAKVLSHWLTLGLSRLQGTMMTFPELQMVVHWVQRTWIELEAAMDYMEIYKPRMDGEEPPPSTDQVAMTMGVFVFLPHVAALYFKARLPFWMVQPMDSRSSQNLLSLIPVTPPSRLVHAKLPPGQPIWCGPAGDILKILAIQETAFGTMGYANPFNIDSGFSAPPALPSSSTVVVSSSSTRAPSPTPSTSSTSTHTSSRGASQGSRSSKSRKRNKNPYKAQAPEAPGNQTFRIRLDAFQPVTVSEASRNLLPKAILSWQDALKRVNADVSIMIDAAQRGRDDSKFMFPTIAALTVGNAERLVRQFTTWGAIREACIYRAISSSSQSRPLSHQDWRNFLHAPAGPNSTSPQEIFKGPFFDLGIDPSSLQSLPLISFTNKLPLRRMVWEVCEYNFRCELRALDHRICRVDVEYEDHQERLQNALSADPDSSSGLFVFDHRVATIGLASLSFAARLDVLKSLRDLMLDWEVPVPPLLAQPSSDVSERFVKAFEDELCKYYCQTFFNYFGRAASIPYSLHQV